MFISLFRNPCICLLSFGLARSLARLEPLKIWFLFRFMILFIALLIITIKISLCFYRILASSLKIFTVRHDWKKPPGKVYSFLSFFLSFFLPFVKLSGKKTLEKSGKKPWKSPSASVLKCRFPLFP